MWSRSGPPSHSGFTWEAHLLWSWSGQEDRMSGRGHQAICQPRSLGAGCAGRTPLPPCLGTHGDLAPDTVQASDALVALDAFVAPVTFDRGIALDPGVLHHLQGTEQGTAGAPTDPQASPLL